MNDDHALEKLRYPIGKLKVAEHITATMRNRWIDELSQLPERLRILTEEMTPIQLQSPYREGSWTAAQVVHHLADSHINAYIRTRFCLAEDNFTVQPYDENRWAQFADASSSEIEPSLELLRGLHQRWAQLLRTLSDAQFAREMVHPERGAMTLEMLLEYYAWHGQHHLGHLEIVKGLGEQPNP